MNTLDDFTKAYIECALWSTHDESTPDGGVPLDANHGIHDLHPNTLAAITDDCQKFQKENAADISGDPSAAGHDFWLTRNSSLHASQDRQGCSCGQKTFEPPDDKARIADEIALPLRLFQL